MKESIWAEPRPDDGRCFCYHPHGAHDESGHCSWDSYGEACTCHRYRNLAQIRRARREEKFWANIGNHTDW